MSRTHDPNSQHCGSLSFESFNCGGVVATGRCRDYDTCAVLLIGSKRYSDNPDQFGSSAMHAYHISCLFRTSEETLAIILELFHLRFPRLPHGPVLSKQSSELCPLLLL